MSTAIQCSDCVSILNFQNIGSGADFESLKKHYDTIVAKFRETSTLGYLDDVYQSLDEIFEECSEENWDGYDALPISEDVVLEAKRLIESLPATSSIPMPEIVPEPTGEIGLEWYKSKRSVFVVSVNGKNEAAYAGLFGPNKTHGEEYFGDSIPSVIIDNLKRLFYKV